MTDTIAKVLEFHEAFGCDIGAQPCVPCDPANEKVEYGAEKLRQALAIFKQGANTQGACALRLALITEELAELAEACADGSVASALDALVDLRYVLDGTVIAFGFHLPPSGTDDPLAWSIFGEAFSRVHDANMAKLQADGTPLRDATGKVVKPAGWVAADLSDLVV